MANKFGPGQKKNKYDIYEGKEVRISYGQDGGTGIFDKYEDGVFYLNPSLIFENEFDGQGQMKSVPKIEREIPTIVEPKQMPIKIERLNDGYLEKIIETHSNYREKINNPTSKGN